MGEDVLSVAGVQCQGLIEQFRTLLEQHRCLFLTPHRKGFHIKSGAIPDTTGVEISKEVVTNLGADVLRHGLRPHGFDLESVFICLQRLQKR